MIITSILLHTYFIKKLNQGFITEKEYIKKLKSIILPLITIFIFINEIMLFLIPYHIFLSLNVFYNKNKLNKKIYLYLLLSIPIYLIITHPMNIDLGKSIFEKLDNKANLDFWIIEAISNNSIVSRLQTEGVYMLTNLNILRYLSIFLIFSLPIFFLFNYLNFKVNTVFN